jgi:hypothetical protein
VQKETKVLKVMLAQRALKVPLVVEETKDLKDLKV